MSGGQPYWDMLAQQADLVLPHMSVVLPSDEAAHSIESRMIGNQVIAHLRFKDVVAEASGRRANLSGLGKHFKLLWQLAGSVHFEYPDQSLTLNAGEMLISRVSMDYKIETSADADSLLLFFDPSSSSSWQETVHREMARPLPANGAITAAAGGVAALLRHNGSAADSLVADALIDLALSSADAPDEASFGQSLPAEMIRVQLIVAANIAEAGYGPDRLAHDLGLSRRSLYNRLGRLGLTPSDFIRQQRLDLARRQIIRGSDSLTMIALGHGFSDSAHFSHAFKAAYGYSPNVLRKRHAPH
ncbi:AraC family transcriptional regulator [Sphingomonas sp. OK281]|uniref:AraC family transcriptional regulator n=1 Tax=Sphingomonas sp. OK281 TaxID=1881067 RepID=UPI001113406F|nr:AraC family transcriptional regulator [Sphingomonas sp. OK281]